MLQRIQTVYLLLIVALMAAVMFLPLATVQVGNAFHKYDIVGIQTTGVDTPEMLYPTWGLFALTAIIMIIALVTVFLYKKRILQIRLCIFNAFLLLGFYGLVAFLLWSFSRETEMAGYQLKIALAFPFIALIIDYLAIRNIGADEALVRSLERLR